jgi:RHS repeat-associated protein
MTYPAACLILRSIPESYKFTGKERDSESGLDNFGARYNASAMGRFMTPDCRAVLKRRTIPVRCKFRVLKDRKTISSCT